MATTTVTGYLLDRLAELGVRHLFGVPGDYNLQLLDEVVAHPAIEWVGTANELGAAYAADGYARMRGIGALLTTSGVGELSALNGLAGSYAELLPVVHITGSPKSAFERTGASVHHTAADGDYERFARAAESVSCALATLTPENAAGEIDRVLLAALRERRPVYLRIPADVATAPIDSAEGALVVAEPEVDEDALQGFLRHAQVVLGRARTAVVLADHLVDRYGAQHELDLLLAESNLPYADLAMGKGLVDESDPRFAGTYFGAFSRPGTREAVESADVLIQAGVRFTDTTSGFFSQQIDATRVIDLQPEAAKVGSALYAGVPLKAALAGLAKLFVDLPPFAVEAPVAGDARAAADAPTLSATARTSSADGLLSQDELWSHVTTFLRGDHFVVADQGTAFFGMSGQPLPAGAGFIGQPLWGSIGYALPALLGAQLADDRRRGILLTGDSAAQMTVQELGSMVRYGVSPIVVLVNNQGYTIERAINGPRAAYNDIAPWNWHTVAAAMTADQALLLTARTALELDEALAEADAAPDRLVFLEVHTGIDDIPPLLARIAAAAGGRAA
ncbi:thiamine pyrophosphate-binding protein [Kribbella sp. NPDC051770]|uniref:alpha-keto acid decarboxylase family protein n=1 Tax=Kribbella sp. NPDC051770 TaxID=3155413 RepID=UPI0034488C8B